VWPAEDGHDSGDDQENEHGRDQVLPDPGLPRELIDRPFVVVRHSAPPFKRGFIHIAKDKAPSSIFLSEELFDAPMKKLTGENDDSLWRGLSNV